MRIAYIPYESANKYIEISQECIKSCGHEIVDFQSVPWVKTPCVDIAILNWYESIGGTNFIKVFLKALIRRVRIILLKTHGVKIIFTFHNRIPHDMKGAISTKIARNRMKWLIRRSDRVIILSKASTKYLSEYMDGDEIKRKVSFIPHPNYIGAYTDNTVFLPPARRDAFHILFVGSIRRYKNVELLIRVARKLTDLKVEIAIAGKPQNEAYSDELKKSIIDLEYVHLDLRFIPDEEIDTLIQKSDVLVLPYNVQSSMNSGMVYLAFSNGRTVICPLISSLKDFDDNLYYSYMYTSEEDHVEKLEYEIRKAYRDWNTDIENYEKRGRTLFEIVQKNNSKEMIVQYYVELFKKIGQ